MLLYLNQAWQRQQQHEAPTLGSLKSAIQEGAGMRIRPIMMTAATVIVGLLPILYGAGTGSEVMSRIAAPMVGGMVSSVLLTLFVLPAIYFLWKKKKVKGGQIK